MQLGAEQDRAVPASAEEDGGGEQNAPQSIGRGYQTTVIWGGRGIVL